MDAEHQHRYSTTAARGRWPARTQRLLGVIGPLCAQWLEPALQHCLDRFDRELYLQAERSRSHLEQQHCFDSRGLLHLQRAGFMSAFADHLRNSFARLGEIDEAADGSLAHRPLSLLERGEHELTAALDKLSARGEAHHSLLLSELSYRFAALVGAAPLEGAALPIAPAGLAGAMRTAVATLDLPPEHRLLLLQSFEQWVIVAAEPLYEAVNAQLLDDGLLPRLRPYAPPRATAGPRGAATGETPPATTATTAESAGAPQAPITVLETLRDLLAQQRVGVNGTAATGRAASPDELQAALGALQQHLAQVTDQASRELRSAQRLRDELLLQLNAGKPEGAVPTRLSAEQDDTVELVAMLFEQIGRQLHHGPHARSVLDDLQLPMLRLAVTDRDFFDQREHPARRLLGAVAEAANDWLDGPDGEVDHRLTERLHQLVERARHEPPSAGLYTSLLADIEHHLAQLSRRAQTAERRHVEAMQGRERLDLARRRASELLAERFAVNPPRGLLRALLDRAWADALALTLLQHGEDSPAFTQRLRVTDQLLGRLPVDDTDLLRREVQAGLQQIGMHAEEAGQVALRLIGTEPAVSTTVDAMPPPSPPATVSPASDAAVAPLVDDPSAATALPAIAAATLPSASAPVAAAPTQDLPSATDLALRLKQRQRLGESPRAKPVVAEAAEPPLGPQEARIHNRLRHLPYGSWFEFTDPATGEVTRRKLAWFSPVTGNSLFVTRRGQHGVEMNLRELVHAMTHGQVRELPPQRDGLLDRAWHALTGNLLRHPSSPTPGARP
ncbi:DUF1631 family protein [Dyella agri]|uniref:DUF1631 family protein n=1 Tax=Dyella agri TaxID=1926869 RepID=A0ABW8KGC8_9GAMM